MSEDGRISSLNSSRCTYNVTFRSKLLPIVSSRGWKVRKIGAVLQSKCLVSWDLRSDPLPASPVATIVSAHFLRYSTMECWEVVLPRATNLKVSTRSENISRHVRSCLREMAAGKYNVVHKHNSKFKYVLAMNQVPHDFLNTSATVNYLRY